MADAAFATLGPAGSNHDLVLQAYLAREEIGAGITYCEDFDEALAACAWGRSNRIFICAAHHSCGHVVGVAQYRLGLSISEVFLAESQPLAILHRIARPQTIALHPATRDYADLNAYETVLEVASTVAAGEGLAKGQWDAALCPARFKAEGFTIERQIAPPRDAWLVLGGDATQPVWRLGQ